MYVSAKKRNANLEERDALESLSSEERLVLRFCAVDDGEKVYARIAKSGGRGEKDKDKKKKGKDGEGEHRHPRWTVTSTGSLAHRDT
jgi:hypothetical protein